MTQESTNNPMEFFAPGREPEPSPSEAAKRRWEKEDAEREEAHRQETFRHAAKMAALYSFFIDDFFEAIRLLNVYGDY